MGYVIKQDVSKTSLWKNKGPALVKLDIELTERCNNNCVHCCINIPADDREAKRKELSSDQIKKILKEAVSLGCMSVRFTGGEPFLRDDFEDLYVFARRLGLKVLLFTNATLINEHLAELFSRIPPLERIEVTVYGMKKSSYEAVTRVKGSFEAFWRGVNLLLERKIPFIVKGALLPSNKNEVDEFEAWAKEISWMEGRLPSYSMFFDLRCRRDEKKNQLIINLRLSAEEGLKIITRNKEAYVKEMKQFCAKFMRPSADKLFSCGSGHGGCVDAYGFFKPCMMLTCPDTMYDLKNGSLEDALTNFFPKVRQIKADNTDYLKRCAKCFLKGFCEQCPAKSYLEYGALDKPVEYLCEIAHTQARYLGLVGEKENSWEVENWQERIKNFTERKD